MKVSYHQQSEDRLPRRMRQMKGGELKLSMIISIICSFFNCKYIFLPIPGRFTHISFQALDFLLFHTNL